MGRAEGEQNQAQGTGTNQRQLWSPEPAARVGSSGEQQPEAETSDLSSVFPLLAVGKGEQELEMTVLCIGHVLYQRVKIRGGEKLSSHLSCANY